MINTAMEILVVYTYSSLESSIFLTVSLNPISSGIEYILKSLISDFKVTFLTGYTASHLSKLVIILIEVLIT